MSNMHRLSRAIVWFASFPLLAVGAHAAQTDISTTPLDTYSAPSSTDVKPNILFVLDDSGSMDWTYLPDQVDGYSGVPFYYRNNALNGVAYSPAVKYSPPVYYNADGTLNTIQYQSMDGTTTARGADSTGKPNWKAVPRDAYGVQSSSQDNLTTAYAYVSIVGEYCTTPALTSCTTATAPTGSYTYPAIVRWCDSLALTNCRATYDAATYKHLRMAMDNPLTAIATITVTASNNARVSGITVSGEQILTWRTDASNTDTTVASRIAANINACTSSIAGNCTVTGYRASTGDSNVVTIYGPAGSTATPVVTMYSGSMTSTVTAFAQRTIPGQNILYTINSGVNSYAYPGTSAKHPNRADCAGTTCTYNEEMTNYANWYAYYRTRMQMMKTSASIAFGNVDLATDVANNVSRFRVGYLSINNNTGSDYLNLGEFKTAQKNAWYLKLFAADPDNSTPLRRALSTAGQLYGGQLNGTSLNGSTVIDPLQYSCQQNYTILSTDGYWNSSGGKKLDASTDMDNQDTPLPAPYNDGGTANIQERTSQLQSQTSQLLVSTSTLQTRTSDLQSSTSTLQSETGTLRGTVAQVLLRCDGTSAACGAAPATGIPAGSWYATGSTCTVRNTAPYRQCARVTPSPSLTRDVDSVCNTSATINRTGSNPLYTYTPSNTDGGYDYSSCSYSWTAPAPAGSCTYNVDSTPNTSTTLTATRCSYSAWTAPVAGACTPSAQTTSTTNGTAYNAAPVACSYTTWTPWTDAVASCTTVPQSTGSGAWNLTARGCQYTTTSPPTYVGAGGSCTAVPQSTSSPYTTLLARTCSYGTYTTWVDTSSCTTQAQDTTSPHDVDTATNCRYNPSTWTGWTTVASCTPIAKSTTSPYTVDLARECQTLTSGGTSNTLADVAAYYYLKDLRKTSTENAATTASDQTGTCTGPIIPPATTATNLCNNDVPPAGDDTAATQHMTTFTLGLGAQGKMLYSQTYAKDDSGDYHDIKAGTTATASICNWQTVGTTCTWPVPSSDSIANIDDLWHAAVNGRGTYYSAKDPDSLAKGLADTLSTIANIPRSGTAAAAASSNPNVSSSDNYVFSSYYRSVEWWGEFVRRQLDANGNLSSPQWSALTMLDCDTTPWKAATSYKVGAAYNHGGNCYKVNVEYVSGASFGSTDTDNVEIVPNWTIPSTETTRPRTLYTKGAGATELVDFTWANLITAGKDAYFKAPAITYTSPTSGLSQFCTVGDCLNSTQQSNTTIATGGAAGEALVNFLRGDRTYEGSYFRERVHVLGDIVASEGRYVKTPLFNYLDANYAAFKASMSSRVGTAYISANDGMMHAFDAATGAERWAYIPNAMLPNLYKLADTQYSTKHQFFVDASPETGDICPNAPADICAASEWKTILVGGYNRGGKGYFALDITDPASPALLWEIDSSTSGFANLGYSYSNPRITKLRDGTWVVIFASGYNNADGVGYLYIVNANTGTLIRTISTGVGSATTPSGLARIAAHSQTASTDNTTRAVYGGDLLGNLWRFDINGDIGASGHEAHLLVTLLDSSNNPQPITEKPAVSTTGGKTAIFVGTGKFLGTSDVGTTQGQSFYAVKDNYDENTFANPRDTGSGFVEQVLTSGTCPSGAPASVCSPGQTVRLTTSNSVDWTDTGVHGWYFDLIGSGERSTTDPTIVLGTLVFTSIAPSVVSANACGPADSSDAASYAYAVDYRTGGAISGTQGVAGVSLGNVLATRPVVVKLESGSVRALIRTSGGAGGSGDKVIEPPIQSLSAGTRRVSWRELVNDQ